MKVNAWTCDLQPLVILFVTLVFWRKTNRTTSQLVPFEVSPRIAGVEQLVRLKNCNYGIYTVFKTF